MKWLVRDTTFFWLLRWVLKMHRLSKRQKLSTAVVFTNIPTRNRSYSTYLWRSIIAACSIRKPFFCCSFLLFRFMIYAKSHFFGLKEIFLFFSKLASRWNPPNPAIWLVPRAGSFSRSCPLTRLESLAASFTSLFVVCEWAKPVIVKPFLF